MNCKIRLKFLFPTFLHNFSKINVTKDNFIFNKILNRANDSYLDQIINDVINDA